MDNLIYIWIINRLLEFCYKIFPFFIGSAAIALVFFIFTLGGMLNDLGVERALEVKRGIKKWMIWSVILSFLVGILGTFALNKTEFKTVAVYLIGKEVVQSERAEKIITIIDTKLDEWVKKVEDRTNAN